MTYIEIPIFNVSNFIMNNFYSMQFFKVMQTCHEMILECYWFGFQRDCGDLFDVRPTDNGFCCSFNTLKMSEQL